MSCLDLPRACSTAFQSGSAPRAGGATANAATSTVITITRTSFMDSMTGASLLTSTVEGYVLHALLIDRRAVARRQERADDVACCVEGQGVGAAFRRHGLLAPQRCRAEHLDDARLADRHVEAIQRRVEEDDVGNAGDRLAGDDLAVVRVHLE